MGVVKHQIDTDIQKRRAFAEGAPLFENTKRLSWQELKESGKLYDRQCAILQLLEDHNELTMQRMAELLHVPVNCITGPLYELRSKEIDLVEKAGKEWNDATHRYNKTFKLKQ